MTCSQSLHTFFWRNSVSTIYCEQLRSTIMCLRSTSKYDIYALVRVICAHPFACPDRFVPAAVNTCIRQCVLSLVCVTAVLAFALRTEEGRRRCFFESRRAGLSSNHAEGGELQPVVPRCHCGVRDDGEQSCQGIFYYLLCRAYV